MDHIWSYPICLQDVHVSQYLRCIWIGLPSKNQHAYIVFIPPYLPSAFDKKWAPNPPQFRNQRILRGILNISIPSRQEFLARKEGPVAGHLWSNGINNVGIPTLSSVLASEWHLSWPWGVESQAAKTTAVLHSIDIRNTIVIRILENWQVEHKKIMEGGWVQMTLRISIEWFLGSSAIQASDDTKLTQPNTPKIDTFKQPITSITKYKKESLFQALFFCKGLLDHVCRFVPDYSTNFRVIFFTQINVSFVTISPQ